MYTAWLFTVAMLIFESAACIQHLEEDLSGRCVLRLQSGVVWLCLQHCRMRVVCFEALKDGKISFGLLLSSN